MTTFLYNSILSITPGAQKVAATDPHGWTLTLISVSVVFVALAILFVLYTLSGMAFTRLVKPKGARRRTGKSADAATAAAIALALEAESGSETQAAIALALELELASCAHDTESGIITIRGRQGGWNNKSFNFRKSPKNGKL